MFCMRSEKSKIGGRFEAADADAISWQYST